MTWRSREKWISRAIATSWAHKHPYPRSLNLKAVLPQLQTLSISSAIDATTYKIRTSGSALNGLLQLNLLASSETSLLYSFANAFLQRLPLSFHFLGEGFVVVQGRVF